MSNVLFFTSERIIADDGTTKGPGIRTIEMAKALRRRKHSVTIAETGHIQDTEIGGVPIIAAKWDRLSELTRGYDVAILPLMTMRDKYFREVRIPTVVDAYDTLLIEAIHRMDTSKEALYEYAAALQRHAAYLQHGDFFLCATPRQRSFYIGALSQLGRLNPIQRTADDLIAEVPIAASPEKPRASNYWSKRGFEKAIIWPGGIYPWFDAETSIHAMQKVAKQSDAKLIFIGAPCHPSSIGYLGFVQARKLAQEAHLLDRSVFFEPWLFKYEQRSNAYADALFAVVTQRRHLETEFSWRTRTIDCLWGGLPVICSEGDDTSQLVASAGAGITVPISDVGSLADSMLELIETPRKRKAMADAARKLIETRLNWDAAVEPLDRFCKSPHIAHDKQDSRLGIIRGAFRPSRRLRYNYYIQRAISLLREKGLGHVIKKARDVL